MRKLNALTALFVAGLSLVPVAFVAGCSNSNTVDGGQDLTVAPDMTGPADMFVLSQCGHVGDTGDPTTGIGKFCRNNADCANTPLPTFCSSLGNSQSPMASDTYFCTAFCTAPKDGGAVPDGGPACGANSTCQCGSGGGLVACACTPDSCLGK